MLIGKSEDVNMKNILKWPAGVLSKSNSVTGFMRQERAFPIESPRDNQDQ